ncbi:MAG: hypothetical protein ACK5LC_16055, partial [Coprobacillaceae bacterium]
MYGNNNAANMQQGNTMQQQGQGAQPQAPQGGEVALGWDSPIEKESSLILLPKGTYDYKVLKLEKGHYNGGTKISACPKAILTLEISALIDNQVQVVNVMHNILLHQKTEGFLSEFFISIGQKKKGEPAVMNWNMVPGSTGKCEIGTKEYNGNTYNEVKRFLPKPEQSFDMGVGGTIPSYNP